MLNSSSVVNSLHTTVLQGTALLAFLKKKPIRTKNLSGKLINNCAKRAQDYLCYGLSFTKSASLQDTVTAINF